MEELVESGASVKDWLELFKARLSERNDRKAENSIDCKWYHMTGNNESLANTLG